jgi:2-haloacid dehalogenase
LELGGWLALAGCGWRAAPPRGPSAIRAVAFDLFTIFDPRTIDRRVAEVVGDDAAAFAAMWKTRLFEYCWIRAAAAQYVDFEALVTHSLAYTARARGVPLADAARARLAAAFTELEPWPGAAATLHELRARGLRLAPLANYSPRMIDALLGASGLRGLFDAQISTDAARTYKPDPRAYALAERRFDLPRTQIAFAAFGGWDAAGGKWFGFPTFWVNRLGVAEDELIAADASGPDLAHLASWLAGE